MEIFYIFELLFTTIEMGTTALICHKLFEKRFKWSGVGLGAVAVLNGCLLYANKRLASLFSTGIIIVVMVLIVFGVSLLYVNQLKMIIVVVLLWLTIIYLIDIILSIGACFLLQNEQLAMEIVKYYSWKRVLVLGFSRLIDIILFFVVTKNKRNIIYTLQQGSGLLVVMCGVGYYSLVRLQVATQFPVNIWFIWEHAGELVNVCLMVFVYLVWKDNLNLEKEKIELEQKQDVIIALYEEVKEQNQISSENIHDLKHHVHALRLLFIQDNLEGIDNYLKGMEEDIKYLGSQIWSGDQMLDALLNWKIKEGERKGVDIKIETDVFRCTVEEKDICIILANLLDNAIEACEELDDIKRKVIVSIIVKKNILTLRILNPISQIPKEKKGKFLSAKRNYQSRGYGIESVQRVVKRYHGQLNIRYNEKQFEAVVLLMMPVAQNK